MYFFRFFVFLEYFVDIPVGACRKRCLAHAAVEVVKLRWRVLPKLADDFAELFFIVVYKPVFAVLDLLAVDRVEPDYGGKSHRHALKHRNRHHLAERCGGIKVARRKI